MGQLVVARLVPRRQIVPQRLLSCWRRPAPQFGVGGGGRRPPVPSPPPPTENPKPPSTHPSIAHAHPIYIITPFFLTWASGWRRRLWPWGTGGSGRESMLALICFLFGCVWRRIDLVSVSVCINRFTDTLVGARRVAFQFFLSSCVLVFGRGATTSRRAASKRRRALIYQ